MKKNIKNIFIISITLLFLILVSASYSAKTLIGYVNGEKLVMGVAYTERNGSLMLTTQNANVDWDNLSDPPHSYSEDWQTHPTGFPADWRVGAGDGGVYSVATGADNVLRTLAFGSYNIFGRIIYGASVGTPTWYPPADFSITAKNIQLQYETNETDTTWSILRVGFGGQEQNQSGLYAYQFYCSTMMLGATEYVRCVPRMISLRDGHSIPLHAISYSGFTSGATLTFRLVVRNPIPIEFSDQNKDGVATIPAPGCYIRVEALDASSLHANSRDTIQVTLWTTSGDTEIINLPELFDAQTTVGSSFNCNNNVFWNETPIPVSTTLFVTPYLIKMNLGQTTTFQAAGSPAISGNGTIDGNGSATTYVVYGLATATATVVCSGAAPLTWQSSDTAIGSINSTTGEFTANTMGSVTITATDANGFTGTATVQILTTGAPMAIEPSAIYLQRSALFDFEF